MPRLSELSPERIRAALIDHLARKLGSSGRATAHLVRPLTNDAIARCLAVDPDAVRRALFLAVAERVACATGGTP